MVVRWISDGRKTVIPVETLLLCQVRPEANALRGGDGALYATCAGEKSLPKGRAIGHRIGAGTVKVIHDIRQK